MMAGLVWFLTVTAVVAVLVELSDRFEARWAHRILGGRDHG
jgi:hypothetical protein